MHVDYSKILKYQHELIGLNTFPANHAISWWKQMCVPATVIYLNSLDSLEKLRRLMSSNQVCECR